MGGVERFTAEEAAVLRAAAGKEAEVGEGRATEPRAGFLRAAEAGLSLKVRVGLEEEGLEEPV